MVSNNILAFAAKKYGSDADTLVHIPRTGGKIMNQIYHFYMGDKKCIIKFEPPHAVYKNQLREINAAMDFNHYLAVNHVNVSVPLKSIDEKLVISIQERGEEYIITAFECLSGQTWGYDGSNPNMSFNWGKVMGDMHRAAKDYKPPNERDVQKYIFDSYYWWPSFDELKVYPTVYRIARETLAEIAVLPRDRDSFGVIHGDLHQGNFFTDGDKVSIIDFGDSVYGWFALDVAISLCHALWWGRKDRAGNDYTNLIIENFIKGYFSANKLSEFWVSKIPLFMKYRHLCMDPEKNGLGYNREKWIYKIENDILFEERTLESILKTIENATV